MKWFVRGVFGLALLIVAATVFAPVQAHAAEGFNVITSPLPIKITTSPGKTVETELRIKNLANTAVSIDVSLMKFNGGTTNGQANLQDLTKQDLADYGKWVHFTPNRFTAQPNVWNTVKMTINVPATASLGYYLAATFSPTGSIGAKGAATALKGSTATLVLLDVRDANEKRQLSLADFTANHKIYEYLPANFTVKIRNQGNIYIPPVGNIFITKGGKQIETLDFNTAGGSVLPDSTRTFPVTWKSGFPLFSDRLINGKQQPDGHGGYKQDLHWNFSQANKFRFGKYTAKLLVAYDDGTHDVPLESTLTFWVLPWKLMIIIFLILALIGFGVFAVIRGTVRTARRARPKKDKPTREK